MTNISPFRQATAALIAYGIVGTMLDGALDTLIAFESPLAEDLQAVTDKVMELFLAAETVFLTAKS